MKTLKPVLTFLFILTIASTSFAQESAEPLPEAKDVLAKLVEVTGGADAYKKIKSRVVKGKMTIKEAGISGDITTSTLNDGSYYTEVELGGVGTEKVGSDGTTHWSISNFTGTRIVEGAERDMHVMENDFTSMLHPEKYFKSMKVTAVEKVGEEDCYRMEKVKKDGDTHVDFYSVKTGLMVKTLIPAATPLGKLEIEVIPSDYRKVGDMLISHTSQQKLPGNMTQIVTIEKIELNTELPKETFALPDAIQKLLAKKAEKEAEKAAEEKPAAEPAAAE